MRDSFKIARIAAPHGIRGEVKLVCFLENPNDLTRYNPLVTKQGKSFALRITGRVKDHIIVRIDGINDRNAAEMLRGTELYADATKRPPLGANELYQQDMIGLPARLVDGTLVGKVTNIFNFGAGDILEINHDLLLPLQAPFVETISPEGVTIQLPEYIEARRE